MLETIMASADHTEVYVNSVTSIAVAVLAVAGAGVTVGLPTWLSRRRDNKERAEQRAVLADVRNHVSNDHDTNLRDDIDDLKRDAAETKKVTTAILTELLSMRRDMGDLEDRTETIERRQGASSAPSADFEPSPWAPPSRD